MKNICILFNNFKMTTNVSNHLLSLYTPCAKFTRSWILNCNEKKCNTVQIRSCISWNITYATAGIALQLWPELQCVTSLTLPMTCNIAHMHEWQMFYRLKSAVCLALTARNLAENQSSDADKRFYSNGLGDTGSMVHHVLHNSDWLHSLAFFKQSSMTGTPVAHLCFF